ncbi:uncharacterized protein LOC135290727 isoform X12 [Passer domesticus]|uniref:uncharacterized protein LOC135290727 isoform X12 n=1 Tax=Passer domesticus TaxID=48849 RepID=UPI0030FEFA95
MAGPPQPPQPAGHRQAVPGNRWERLPPVPALARLTLSPVPESGGGGCLRGHAANGPDCPVPLSGRGPCQAAAGAERDCSGSHRQGPAALSGIVLLQLPRNALCCPFICLPELQHTVHHLSKSAANPQKRKMYVEKQEWAERLSERKNSLPQKSLMKPTPS